MRSVEVLKIVGSEKMRMLMNENGRKGEQFQIRDQVWIERSGSYLLPVNEKNDGVKYRIQIELRNKMTAVSFLRFVDLVLSNRM